MQLVNSWKAQEWKCATQTYCGSAHERAVKAEHEKPSVREEKAWRKSLKSKYPSQEVDALLKLQAIAAARLGLKPVDTTKAFGAYKEFMSQQATS